VEPLLTGGYQRPVSEIHFATDDAVTRHSP
jgi:hypothetical protein